MTRTFQARKLILALLLCAAAGASLAQPGWMRDQGQEHPRKRQQAKEMRRDEVRDAHRGKGPMQKREMARQEQGRSQNDSHARNNGRMSPEERRALRRQINEANQSIQYRN